MSGSPTHKVVLNDEDQYSIWQFGQDNPAGWYEEGTSGSREECLQHIEKIWVDMRPRSVREQLVETVIA